MNVLWLCLLLISDSLLINGSSVRLVRLVDHTSYAISIMQKTISEVEQRQWCNLKIEDLNFGVRETVLGVAMSAEIELKNGFVISVQRIDIVQNSIQQVWLPIRNTTMVEVRSTVRMIDVAIGFDVITTMGGKTHRSTGRIVYPEMQFPFTITKHLFTDEITVAVTGTPIRTTNRLEFIPENDVTKVFTILFDWNSTTPTIDGWATNIFRPITLRLATKELEFPRICYDCPV